MSRAAELPPLKLEELIPFAEDNNCPKCGYNDVRASYQPTAHCGVFQCVLHGTKKPDCCKAEHMHRTCVRCRYSWSEGVLRSAR